MPKTKMYKDTIRTDSPILQFKIVLQETVPEIWRRLLVRGNVNLGLLHAIIQIAMGWTNSHLHHFLIDRKRYIDPELNSDGGFGDGEKPIDEKGWPLLEVIRPDISHFQFLYEYDFGDSWNHLITLERIEKESSGFQGFALCLAGERACPPEDCGGVGGFLDFLETVLQGVADSVRRSAPTHHVKSDVTAP
jgi:hypothetical protein